MLVIFSGLPGVGKTALARKLAGHLGGVYLRIDSIEQAIRAGSSADCDLREAGYLVAYAVALDNLRVGHSVVADSVNPIQVTRDAWLEVAKGARVRAVEIEVICSDKKEHRRRVETRATDINGLKLPSWSDVVAREYDGWDRAHMIVDTAGLTVDQNVRAILEALAVSAG